MSKELSVKDLRGSEVGELQSTLKKLQEDLFKNRLKKSTNQLENVMLIRGARRDIARVNTLLAEKLRKGKESASSAETGQSQAKEK